MALRDFEDGNRSVYSLRSTDSSDWRSVKVGSKIVTFEKITKNHAKGHSSDYSNVSLKSEHKTRCGLCKYWFQKSSVVFKVPNHRILELQTSWGLNIDLRKSRSASNLYYMSSVCVFCSQFFDNLDNITIGRKTSASQSSVNLTNQDEFIQFDNKPLSVITTNICRSNLAFDKRCYQSSVVDNLIATNAITPPYDKGARTRREVDAWWEIDFGEPTDLFSIHLQLVPKKYLNITLYVVLLDKAVGFENPFLDEVRRDCLDHQAFTLRSSPNKEVQELSWDLPHVPRLRAVRVQAHGMHSLHLMSFKAERGDLLGDLDASQQPVIQTNFGEDSDGEFAAISLDLIHQQQFYTRAATATSLKNGDATYDMTELDAMGSPKLIRENKVIQSVRSISSKIDSQYEALRAWRTRALEAVEYFNSIPIPGASLWQSSFGELSPPLSPKIHSAANEATNRNSAASTPLSRGMTGKSAAGPTVNHHRVLVILRELIFNAALDIIDTSKGGSSYINKESVTELRTTALMQTEPKCSLLLLIQRIRIVLLWIQARHNTKDLDILAKCPPIASIVSSTSTLENHMANLAQLFFYLETGHVEMPTQAMEAYLSKYTPGAGVAQSIDGSRTMLKPIMGTGTSSTHPIRRFSLSELNDSTTSLNVNGDSHSPRSSIPTNAVMITQSVQLSQPMSAISDERRHGSIDSSTHQHNDALSNDLASVHSNTVSLGGVARRTCTWSQFLVIMELFWKNQLSRIIKEVFLEDDKYFLEQSESLCGPLYTRPFTPSLLTIKVTTVKSVIRPPTSSVKKFQSTFLNSILSKSISPYESKFPVPLTPFSRYASSKVIANEGRNSSLHKSHSKSETDVNSVSDSSVGSRHKTSTAPPGRLESLSETIDEEEKQQRKRSSLVSLSLTAPADLQSLNLNHQNSNSKLKTVKNISLVNAREDSEDSFSYSEPKNNGKPVTFNAKSESIPATNEFLSSFSFLDSNALSQEKNPELKMVSLTEKYGSVAAAISKQTRGKNGSQVLSTIRPISSQLSQKKLRMMLKKIDLDPNSLGNFDKTRPLTGTTNNSSRPASKSATKDAFASALGITLDPRVKVTQTDLQGALKDPSPDRAIRLNDSLDEISIGDERVFFRGRSSSLASLSSMIGVDVNSLKKGDHKKGNRNSEGSSHDSSSQYVGERRHPVSNKGVGNKPGAQESHQAVSFSKRCLLCERKYPSHALQIRVLYKHVVQIRQFLSVQEAQEVSYENQLLEKEGVVAVVVAPSVNGESLTTRSQSNIYNGDQQTTTVLDSNISNGIPTDVTVEYGSDAEQVNLSGENDGKSMAIYRTVVVCTFCSQFFDPDSPDGVTFPAKQTLPEYQAELKANDGSLMTKFVDSRYESRKVLWNLKSDERAIQSRASARKALDVVRNINSPSKVSTSSTKSKRLRDD